MTDEFDVLEAKRLLEVYKNNGSTEKEKFLAELILLMHNFAIGVCLIQNYYWRTIILNKL